MLAYLGAYVVGSIVSYSLLRHLLHGLETPRLLRYVARLVPAAAVAAAAGWLVRLGLDTAWADDGDRLRAVVMLAVVAGVDGVVFLLMARLLRIGEVTAVVGLITSRLGRGRTA